MWRFFGFTEDSHDSAKCELKICMIFWRQWIAVVRFELLDEVSEGIFSEIGDDSLDDEDIVVDLDVAGGVDLVA